MNMLINVLVIGLILISGAQAFDFYSDPEISINGTITVIAYTNLDDYMHQENGSIEMKFNITDPDTGGF